MRIAQLIDGMRDAGGAERLQQTLAIALRPRDVELTVITLGDDQARALRDLERLGVRVVRFPARRFASPARARRLHAFLREERFDVVHSHLARSIILGGLLSRATGTPAVASIHNSRPSARLSRPLFLLQGHVLRRCTERVIAVGWETARAAVASHPGIDPIVIPNAVVAPEGIGAGERLAVRRELGVAHSECLLVSVGRLARAKRFELLIDALARVRERAPHARLCIAGEGRERATIERRIAERGLGSHAALLGLRRDVWRILAAGDVYASSSDYEGLPLSTLEAMHAGLPVVATRVGDVPHVVTPETGILVERGDAEGLARGLLRLVEDRDVRRALGGAGRARAEQCFGLEAWAARLVELYSELASARSARHRRRRSEAVAPALRTPAPDEGPRCAS